VCPSAKVNDLTATSRPRRFPKTNLSRRMRWGLGIAVLLVVGAAAALAVTQLRGRATADAGRAATQSVRVSRGPIEGRAAATGALALVKTTTIAPLASGILRDLRVAVGDAVENGQVIAVLDTSALKADLTKAELELDTTRAELAQAKAPYTESDITAARSAV
jgi:membrane fusion protein, macrolide-specific efflux system